MVDFLMGLVSAIMETGTISPDQLMIENGVTLELMNKIWKYFVIVGIGMTVIYFLMELNQKLALEGRDMNMKSFFAPFLKLMIAIAVLSQGAKIVGWLIDINNSVITWMGTNTNLVAGDLDSFEAIRTQIEDLGFFQQLIAVLPLIVFWIISLVLQLVWWYKTLTFKVEFFYRIGISPIALADVYSGNHSNAVKWLKGFLVLTIYGASMIVLPRIGMTLFLDSFGALESEAGGTIALTGDNLWALLQSLAMMFVVPFASLGCMSAAKSMAKEALGA